MYLDAMRRGLIEAMFDLEPSYFIDPWFPSIDFPLIIIFCFLSIGWIVIVVLTIKIIITEKRK
ncbi:MAG: hypothetical protein ACTSQN_15900 [Candidatus Heimdallarchaeota archaeon]